MISFSIDLNTDEAFAILTDTNKKASDMPALFEKIRAREVTRDSIQKAFNDETSPSTGEKWEASKRAIKQGTRTLEDTGDLNNDMMDLGNYTLTGNSLKVRTTTVYGGTHNFGKTVNIFGKINHTFVVREFAAYFPEHFEKIENETLEFLING